MPESTKQSGRLVHTDALRFMLAGDAIVTLRNVETGNRFTYRIRGPKNDDTPRGEAQVRFVSLLRGPENARDYQYAGTIFDVLSSPRFRGTAKSRVAPNAPSFRAFDYVFNALAVGATLPNKVEIWHEGRCGRCGRLLTVPGSVARGIGPECAGLMGVA